jgi:hypothetical protein
MLEQAFDSLRTATESMVRMQQEMFQKWVHLWPYTAWTSPNGAFGEKVQQFQKKWTETVSEIVKRQRETSEAQFKVGVENIEKAFQLGEVKTVEDLRARVLELWRKCFDALHTASEAQVRDFQFAIEKWMELVSKK